MDLRVSSGSGPLVNSIGVEYTGHCLAEWVAFLDYREFVDQRRKERDAAKK